MPLRRFLPYDVLGAGAWAATFATLGYVFWHSFDQLTHLRVARAVRVRHGGRGRRRRSSGSCSSGATRRSAARRSAPGSTSGATGPAGAGRPRSPGRCGGVVGRPTAWRRRPRRALRPGRLTPGQLGLELTTLLALLAVGAFTFFFLGDVALEPRHAANRPLGRRPRRAARDRTRSSTSPRSSPTSARCRSCAGRRARHGVVGAAAAALDRRRDAGLGHGRSR